MGRTRAFRTVLRRGADAACLLFAACVVVFFASRYRLAGWPPWFALVNSFAPFLFLPLPLVTLWAVLRRQRVALAAAGVALCAFVLVYGRQLIPKAAVASGGEAIDVMTFNLGPFLAGPETVAAAIAAADADIVALQELTPAFERAIRTELEARYPYSVLEPESGGRGLLSRFAVEDVAWIQGDGGQRASLSAKITAHGHELQVFAPHPTIPEVAWREGWPLPIGLDTSRQERQLLDLGERAKASEGSVLVIGDFNLSDQSRAYRTLTETLDDAFREAGWGFGFTFPHGLRAEHLLPSMFGIRGIPLPGPLLRLDFIMHSDDMRAESAQVGCDGGSDHCYVRARLLWRSASGRASE